MKFKSSNQTLVRGISAVQNAVGRNLNNPIVENIHLKCADGKVEFLATNLNLTIRCICEAEIEEPGQIVIPSDIITELVRDLPDGEVNFDEKDETIKISCCDFKAKMKGQSADLFPPLTLIQDGTEITLEAETFRDIIKKTIYSATSDKSRYELDGVKFSVANKEMVCCSTDGRRLCIFNLIREDFKDKEIQALIPSKALIEISKTMPSEGDVLLRFEERRFQLDCGDTTIISNLLKDNFPPFEKIIPPAGNIKLKLDRQNLATAVKRASNLSSIEMKKVYLKLFKGYMEIFCEREEIGGEGSDKVNVEYDGESMEMNYNYRFLLDFLKIVDEEFIEMEISDPEKPAIFRIFDNLAYRYILMPMKSKEED